MPDGFTGAPTELGGMGGIIQPVQLPEQVGVEQFDVAGALEKRAKAEKAEKDKLKEKTDIELKTKGMHPAHIPVVRKKFNQTREWVKDNMAAIEEGDEAVMNELDQKKNELFDFVDASTQFHSNAAKFGLSLQKEGYDAYENTEKWEQLNSPEYYEGLMNESDSLYDVISKSAADYGTIRKKPKSLDMFSVIDNDLGPALKRQYGDQGVGIDVARQTIENYFRSPDKFGSLSREFDGLPEETKAKYEDSETPIIDYAKETYAPQLTIKPKPQKPTGTGEAKKKAVKTADLAKRWSRISKIAVGDVESLDILRGKYPNLSYNKDDLTLSLDDNTTIDLKSPSAKFELNQAMNLVGKDIDPEEFSEYIKAAPRGTGVSKDDPLGLF